MLAIERDILEPRLQLHHATLTDLLARAARSTSSRATREAIEAVVRFAHEDRQRMLADLYAPPIDTPASIPRRQQDGAVAAGGDSGQQDDTDYRLVPSPAKEE